MSAADIAPPGESAPAAGIELPSRLLTAEDLAGLLGIKTATVYLWARRGKLPPGRLVGKFRRWTPAEIRVHLEARGS
jgi:predicted DNA-binding transcriptional regulator AlpA